MHRISLLIALIVTASILSIPTAAFADDGVDTQITYALQMAPGGVQTAWNEVAWADGTILTVAPASATAYAAAAAACPSGRFCAFSDPNGTGSRLQFTTCPSSNSVAALPQVLSITSARSSGTVTGRKGSTVIVTVNPGTTKNVTKAIDRVACAL